MWPSPSWGGWPNGAGARRKLASSTLATTARFSWREPLRGEIISITGSPGTGARFAVASSSPSPSSRTARRGDRRGGQDADEMRALIGAETLRALAAAQDRIGSAESPTEEREDGWTPPS